VKLPPLSLYVHLPWCVRKCPYCDFNSHTAGEAAPKERYIKSLLMDLARESVQAENRELDSIFLGGGTPSLFTPAEIEQVLAGVRASFSLSEDVEVTMEANPGTVECGSPAGYRDAGVNRLSIGAQSFDDAMLKTLGRIHSSADISRAVSEAAAAGFDNINIDLMHGLPDQTVEMALDDLSVAMRLGPAHVSWYELTLEPNTVFYARPPDNLPDSDLAFEIQERGQTMLAEQGYLQYEVSAYARNEQRCRHNLNYWLFGDYLAVGAGAHGKLTTAAGIHRYQKAANPLQYMMSQESDDFEARMSKLDQADLIFEFMLNALRLSAGFAEMDFTDRTGLTVADLEKATVTAREKGLIERDGDGFWRATGLGKRFLNDLQSEFIPDTA
jgi:putative oxygen-independent coproporphyrinogen III oxidase